MLNIINRPDLKDMVETFSAGQNLFLEGDATQDIYILVSGKLDVIKGDKKISEIIEPGSLFGEMSFLLREKRTATVKARDTVEAFHIPCEKVAGFMKENPDFAQEIAKFLAQRLQVTTDMIHGMKEFCDQLPDAVMITADRDQKILACNMAAERLYGRTTDQLRDRPLNDIYEESEEYQHLKEEMQSGKPLKDKTVKIKHPEKGERFVSLSTTTLYDGHHDIQGYLLLGRDVTRVFDLEKRHQRIKRWMVPVSILTGVMVVVLFWAYPKFSKGRQILDHKKQSFISRISKDHTRLISELHNPFIQGDHKATEGLLRGYFANDDPTIFGISGLVLLNSEKKVVSAYSPSSSEDSAAMIGNSYSGIKFSGDDASAYRLLTLFRSTPNNPMGEEGAELAFALDQSTHAGWLLFQLDMNWLGVEYGIDVKALKNIRFPKLQ